jgi:hypothetical protein
MANQTANRDYKRQQAQSLPYKAAAVDLFIGSLVSLNASGFAKGGADTAGEKFVGVLREQLKNSTGAAGAVDAIVWTEGAFEFAFSGTAVQANVGLPVYLVDNQTVALAATTTNDILVGRITEFVSANVVRVKITPEV